MSRTPIAVLVLFAISTVLIPLEVLADGGHESVERDPMTTAIFVISIALALAAVCGLYLLPSRKFNTVQLLAAGLGVTTMSIHLFLGLSGDVLLLLNALGYACLLVALFAQVGAANQRRLLMTIVLLFVYTFATFVGYFATHEGAQLSALGIFSKVVEFALMVVLGIGLFEARSATSVTAEEMK